VSAGDQRIEIGQRSENRIDRKIVRHIVAEVLHRRGKERREPDRIDPEPGNVIEPRGHAREIADAIAVGVAEAARIDLIDRSPTPPWAGRLRDGRGGDRRQAVHGGIWLSVLGCANGEAQWRQGDGDTSGSVGHARTLTRERGEGKAGRVDRNPIRDRFGRGVVGKKHFAPGPRIEP
jgi:hypothetical protein